jgi:hypothetical protein
MSVSVKRAICVAAGSRSACSDPGPYAYKSCRLMQTKYTPTDGDGAKSLNARAEPHTRRDILTGMRIVLKCSRGFPRDRRVRVQTWVEANGDLPRDAELAGENALRLQAERPAQRHPYTCGQ